jgi:hypothetical protein
MLAESGEEGAQPRPTGNTDLKIKKLAVYILLTTAKFHASTSPLLCLCRTLHFAHDETAETRIDVRADGFRYGRHY